MGSNGNVTIGDEAINSTQKLRVECLTSAQCQDYTRRAIYGFAGNTPNVAYGVTGRVEDAAVSIGVDGYALNGSMATYGVRGQGIGSSSYGGYFTGGLYVSGGIVEQSDARLKTNIRDLSEEKILSLIMKLQPKRYESLTESQLRSDGYPGTLTAEGEYLGLLAQDVENIFPYLVHEITHLLEDMNDAEETQNGSPDTVTTMGINYIGLIPVLVAGLQEQQEQIEELEARLETLERMMQQ